MRAPQIAAYALVANALLGLGLELTETVPDKVVLVAIVAFLVLEIVAVASLATLRHELSAWAEVGMLAWGAGLLASAYSTTWLVWYLLGGHPTFEVGPKVQLLEQFGRTVGMACTVVALAIAAHRSAVTFASIIWGAVALASLVLYVHLYWDDTTMLDNKVRIAREVAYSSSLIVLAWIATTASRAMQEREPPAARVVS